jgi:hypothetical protein
MKTPIAALVLAACASVARADDESAPRGRVDVVFCIDRSGSMQQVIDTAKRKVWTLVNEMSRAKPSPILRIGLIGYGSADRDLKFFPLSEDLDRVYENLLTFKVDMGGDEWVGWAAKMASERMEWSAEPKALRLIFMVGNETALQGTEDVHYTRTLPGIIRKGIQVNAIYCGRPSPEEERTWKEVAALADGSYATIDLSGGAVTVATPYDARLAELGTKLNGTYLAFGAEGRSGALKQELADRKSAELGGSDAPAARAAAKATAQYSNSGWDLVDAAKDKAFDLSKVPVDQLPEAMRPMSPEQRREHLEKKTAERKAMQEEIRKLAVERQKFIDEEVRKRNLDAGGAFDGAVRRAVREQAEKKGFRFEEPK